MLIVILSVLVVVGVFIVLGLETEKKEVEVGSGYNSHTKVVEILKFKLKGKQALSLLGFLIILFAMVGKVPANCVGIQYNPFNGGTQIETLGEGWHAKSPFTTIYVLSTEVQTKSIGSESSLSGQTKDSQYLSMQIDVKYRIDPQMAYQVFRDFKTLKNVDKALIAPLVQRSIEAVTTKYNIIEILGESRNEVYAEIESDLTQRLADSNIILFSITFVDTDGGDAIETAISQEAVAKKNVDIAEQERIQAEIDAETKIIVAEADKTQAILEAEGKAEAAEKMKEEFDGSTEEYLEFLWIEKWNGIMPTTLVGESEEMSMILD